MKKIILLTLTSVLASGNSFANEKTASQTCGDSIVKIKAQDNSEYDRPDQFSEVEILVTKGDNKVILKEENEFFNIACITNQKKNNFIVYQSYCGGSGCMDYDNYGIIDPSTLNILLKPSDKNRITAGKIVGLKPDTLYELLHRDQFFPK